MKTRIAPSALALLLLLANSNTGAAAPAPAPEIFRISAPSGVEFMVRARKYFTREVIVGKNQGISGSLTVTADGSVSATMDITAAGFKTGNDERDGHVADSLKAKQRPNMTFQFEDQSGRN